MTERERREFALFKTKVKATSNEEDTMATKKNAAQTTINENVNEQEDTMNEQTANTNTTTKETTMFDIPRKANGKYDFVADKAKHAAIRDEFKLGRVKGIELTHAIEGKKLLGGITNDPDELALLAKVAKKLGWCGRVLTVTQAENYMGRPNPEFVGHGWLIKNKPHTNKEGRTTQFMTVVYPIEAFIFNTEDGEPALDEQKALEKAADKAKREASVANRNLRNANRAAGRKNTRRKTNTKKPAEKQVIVEAPVPANAPEAKLIHIKLENGVEFDARDTKEAAELKALFA